MRNWWIVMMAPLSMSMKSNNACDVRSVRLINPFLPKLYIDFLLFFGRTRIAQCQTMDDDPASELHSEGPPSTAPINTSSSILDSHEEAILAELEPLPISTADPMGTPTHAVVTPAPASSDRTHKAKQSYLIAHDDFLSERVMIFHIDLEHSGKDARIVQLLVVAYDPSKGEYCGEFNKYVRPLKNAKWEKGTMEVHGIHPNQERIKNASSIVDVWPRFVNFVESHLENGAKRGLLLHGVENLGILNGSSKLHASTIMTSCAFQSGVHTSWIQVEL
jgi:Exonuclease